MANVDPARPELHACEHEQHRPQEGAGRRIGDERPQRHPGDARRKADERPDDRQEPAEEGGRCAVAFEEVLGDLDLVGSDQQVLAVPLEEGPPAPCPDGVGDERPQRVPDRRDDDDDPVAPRSVAERFELARIGDEEARVGQDQLRGQRHHRRLDRHRAHHPEVADRAVERVEERDDDLVDEGEQRQPQG